MDNEIKFLEIIENLVWNDIPKQELLRMLQDRKVALKLQLLIKNQSNEHKKNIQ